jgi:hypothetical protein
MKFLVLVAAAVTLGTAGCGALPHSQRIIAGEDVSTRLQEALGVPMISDAGDPYSITLANVMSTHFSESTEQLIAVIAFDDSRAAPQALGSTVVAHTLGITVIRRGNILVLYGHSSQAPDFRSKIAHELATIPARLTAPPA